MNARYVRYNENFAEEFDIRYKTGEKTEKSNFHLHKQYEMLYAMSDNLIFCTENKQIPIPKDSILIINSMSLHHIDYRRDSGPCNRYVMIFSPEWVSGLITPEVNVLECFLHNRGIEGTILKVPEEMVSGFYAMMESMTEVMNMTKNLDVKKDRTEWDMNLLFTKFQLGQFLILANKIYHQQYQVSRSGSYQTHLTQTMEICRYLENHYAEEQNMDDLAKKFLLSKTQMYYLFKEILKMSVSEYITQIRIAKAKDLLINTTYSVELISEKVGYSNISSFSRVFKTKTKMNPLAYRKRKEVFQQD